MTDNDGLTKDSSENKNSDRLHTSASAAKGEAVSQAEKKSFLEKLKDSGFDSAFVFHEEDND